ncbi:Endo-1,4-beta-xylanase A precursor [compost metagenome]
MIVNALKLSNESHISTDFADEQDIPSWAKGAVGTMKKHGFIEGTGMNEFNPTAQTTRAEAITALLRILE